jgi:hypothetical protein
VEEQSDKILKKVEKMTKNKLNVDKTTTCGLFNWRPGKFGHFYPKARYFVKCF